MTDVNDEQHASAYLESDYSASSSDHDEERFDQVMSLKAPEIKPWMQNRVSHASSFERVSRLLDLETGKRGGYRAHHVTLRSGRSSHPIRSSTRLRRRMEKTLPTFMRPVEAEEEHLNFRGRLHVQELSVFDDDAALGGVTGNSRQFRLTTSRSSSWSARFVNFIGVNDNQTIGYDDAQESDSCSCWCLGSPESWVRRFFFWSFRTNPAAVLLAAVFLFLVMTTLFATGIYIAWLRQSSCVVGSDSRLFVNAWYLSYQTFTTTGYGVIQAVPSGQPGTPVCIWNSMLTSLEGFFGLVFVSVYAAIIIVKFSRIQSHAPVEFSGPIIVRYAGSSRKKGRKEKVEDERLPCPIIEIRLLNLMSSVSGGELIDCGVNVVAVIDEKQASQTVKEAIKRRKRGRKRDDGEPLGASRVANDSNSFGSTLSMDRMFQSLEESMRAKRDQNAFQIFEEDDTGYLVPKRIFSKLEIATPNHPFFNRTWVLRHELNIYSPLLTNAAREELKRNYGFWPPELNNYEGVRSAMAFDQIVVNFAGTSSAGGNAVYSQKVYSGNDVFIGYNHVPVLYKTRRGNAAIDYTLAHDIIEQREGEGEPLDLDRETLHHNEHIIAL